MKKAILASLAVIAIAIPTAASTARGDATPQATCTPLKQIYSERNWRDTTPADGRRACPVDRRAGARNTVRHWRDYRTYRQIATVKCTRGSRGYFVAIAAASTCGCLVNESHFSWSAYNPSGARGAYQLLAHGEPWPARSLAAQLAHHRIAASLPYGSWVAPGC